MADKDSKRRPQASLTDLLAEHTRIAEQERQEIESRLREKEEEERRRREEEEKRQKELLQQRLEEEKRRAQERFQRQQDRERPEAAVVAAPVAAAPAPAPPQKKSHTLLAVAVTVVLMAGAAAGAWFLLFADRSPDLMVMKRQGTAMAVEASTQATLLIAAYEAAQQAAQQSRAIDGLTQKLELANADIERLKGEMSEAQKAAAEARKAAEEAAAAVGNGQDDKGTPRKTVRSGGSKNGGGGSGIKIRTGIFGGGGKEIVE